MNTSKTSTSSAALAASERSGEAANAAGAELPASRPLVPDSEVIARPHRRRFSAEYKLSIIDQADSTQGAGAVGALLRREGLYFSHLATWRQQRKQGEFDALTAKKRGPKVVVSPLVKENRELQAANARLTKKLKNAALELGSSVGQAVACRALGVPRATLYRRMLPAAPRRVRPTPERALTAAERQVVLNHLHSERFSDKAPAEVFATLIDEGIYLCSIRTMHRILAENRELKERRNQICHPQYKNPELLATGPNQVWTWDITKLLGPAKWTYFHLYVILDIFSRYVVGWMVAPRETAELAKRLIADTCQKQGIVAGTLTIHADRGTSMTSKPVALMLADLGITKTHSRPHVSDDNPYSESQFKTLKYRPEFPERFGSIEDARAFCQRFFPWYNHD